MTCEAVQEELLVMAEMPVSQDRIGALLEASQLGTPSNTHLPDSSSVNWEIKSASASKPN
jgi:hypothetical protein